ncbi:MAG: response regulator transcription factor [Chloroflexota bacterium]
MIRVAIVDDHPHVAIALKALLQETADIQVVAEARQGQAVHALVQQHRPHVLFLDLMMEAGFDPLTAVRTLRATTPDLKICLLSAHLEPVFVRDMLKAGVNGYILKDDDYVTNIESIVRKLADGDLHLSPKAYEALALATRQEGDQGSLTEREREILRLADQGLRNPQIADALHLSAGTVRNHLSAIYRKLDVRGRHQALAVAKEQGIL